MSTASEIQAGQTVRFPINRGSYRREYRITVEVEQVNPWESTERATVWIRGRRVVETARGTRVERVRSYTIDADCPVDITE